MDEIWYLLYQASNGNWYTVEEAPRVKREDMKIKYNCNFSGYIVFKGTIVSGATTVYMQ